MLLAVWCYASAGLTVILSHDRITFYLVSGQSGPVDADVSIRVMVQSNTGWALNYQATPLSGPEGVIMPDRLLVRTPYTHGFESLDIPRLVGKGSATGATPVDVALMHFRFIAAGQERPGVYEGNILSPDGGPTIHVMIKIEPRVEEVPKVTLEMKPVAPKIKMTFSPEKIHFPITGAPKEYDADSTVVLTVKSKHGFIVKAHATSLHGPGEIPASRIFVRSDGDYLSLEKDVVVLERPTEIKPEKERTVSTNLNFRLKTTWDDVAGEYSGQIVFTCEPEM
ncbi:MAG: hypothetical protein AB1348_08075 [Nitrospirota bacterium]